MMALMANPNDTLSAAAYNGIADALMTALANGADVHARDDIALYWAAHNNYVQIIDILLVAGADVHAQEDGALRTAAANGHDDAVRRLLAAGADIHAEDDDALRLAATFGHVEIAQNLLLSGADPIAAWSKAGNSQRKSMISALSACSGVMTPRQRIKLAGESKRFVVFKASRDATRRHKRLRR